MTGPLQGVVILDFTQLVQGPFATQIFGDMGAEIIKVEPVKGDWNRHFALSNHYLNGESISFLGFNRNKRSLTLDLKKAEGVEVAKTLARKADVVIENFRPGVMERLGLGYDVLAMLNPRLIYCASSGYGQTGPYVTRPGQDLLIQAMTAIPTLTGPDGGEPIVPGVSLADLSAGLHIVYGVLAALYHREQTGLGQRVDVNLFSSLLTFLTQEMSLFLNGGPGPQRSSSGIPNPYTGAPYGLYKTSDGYIAVGMNPLNKFAALVGVSGYEDISSNNVMENRDALRAELAKAVVHKTTADWLDILLQADIWCAPLLTLEGVEHDPQVAANEMIVSYEHPTAGTIRGMGMPVKFSATPAQVTRPAPLKGEHTAELLVEYGGYTSDEIARMQADGVFG